MRRRRTYSKANHSLAYAYAYGRVACRRRSLIARAGKRVLPPRPLLVARAAPRLYVLFIYYCSFSFFPSAPQPSLSAVPRAVTGSRAARAWRPIQSVHVHIIDCTGHDRFTTPRAGRLRIHGRATRTFRLRGSRERRRPDGTPSLFVRLERVIGREDIIVLIFLGFCFRSERTHRKSVRRRSWK